MAERVLIAGCGDLGLRVARRLLARGDEVHALRRTPPLGEADGVHWHPGDLTDAASLVSLPAQFSQLVFLPTPDARSPAAYRAVFVEGLRNRLEALDRDRLDRVLLVSSSAVYGEHHGGWVDETTAPGPSGFNGRILLETERWLASQPLPGVVLRLAGLYGPGRLQLIDRLRTGHATVPRALPHWANRIHIDDAASAIAHLLALSGPQPLYLGVDDTPLPLDVLYDHLAALLGAPRPPEGNAPAGVGSKRLSNARLRASGFAPAWPDARDGYAALLAGPVQR
jgi:nucleoside-diphosphate-sugar epimerase